MFTDGEAPFGVREGRCGIRCYKTNGNCVCDKFSTCLLVGDYQCASCVDVPPRIALLGWSRGFIVDYGGQFRGDGGIVYKFTCFVDYQCACGVDVPRSCLCRRTLCLLVS